MLLRASAEFVKHFKCKVSHRGKPVKQERRLDSWSAGLVEFRGKHVVLLMNDATLFSKVIPSTAGMTFERFANEFFKRVLVEWDLRNAALGEEHLSIIVLKRSNRTLIGSMNEAAATLHMHASYETKPGEEADWNHVEMVLNGIPFSALGGATPDEAMDFAVGEVS